MTHHKVHLKKIAITGGIGSGKSTLTRALINLGYAAFDADKLVSDVVFAPSVRLQIESILGQESYMENELGEVVYNRAWVREQVFADEAKRKSLESVIHPALFKAFDDICAQLQNLAGGIWVFYEAALVFESERESFFDAVVSVVVPEEERRARLRASRNLTDDSISAIFAAQVSDSVRRSRSHFILENKGSKENLPLQALELLSDLRQFFHPKNH